jgi:nitroimidazol reductase NimA-like FMN-containing flavoprotein (pyridoxamine 5'-phosphate oxidase superfamily)
MSTLSRHKCEEILERNGIGRLGCFSPEHDEVYVIPVAYVYEHGAAWLELIPGQKLDYLKEHPNGVCLEVEEVDRESIGAATWRTVIATGHFARFEPDPSEQGKARRRPLHTVFEVGLSPYAPERLVLCRLSIEKFSGCEDHWRLKTDLPLRARSARQAAATK